MERNELGKERSVRRMVRERGGRGRMGGRVGRNERSSNANIRGDRD